jgi:uncharacterized protein YegP (UPF0339 family)
MSKLIRLMALMMSISLVTLPATLTMAQDAKKDAKKDDKKDAKKDSKKDSKKSTGTIEIGETAKGKFYFTIRGTDGKYLAGATPIFASKDDALKAIEKLKAALENPTTVDKKGDDDKDEPKKGKDKDKQ